MRCRKCSFATRQLDADGLCDSCSRVVADDARRLIARLELLLALHHAFSQWCSEHDRL